MKTKADILFEQFCREMDNLNQIRQRLFEKGFILEARHLSAVMGGHTHVDPFDGPSQVPFFIADGIDLWLAQYGSVLSEFEKRQMMKCRDTALARMSR